MISLIKIDIEELRDFIEISYKGDEDLLSKYHVAEYSLQQAVESTINMIAITSLEAEMTYFGVVINGQRIGYLCTFKNNLYSFGINMEYRVKEILSEFWNKIKEILGNSFMTVLYPNNTRAIEWVEKCGMKKKECVILLYDD